MRKPFRSNEAYKHLEATHGYRVYAYISDGGRFRETQLKELVQTCRQNISYCRVGSNHKNAIVKLRMKELTLGSWTLLLHATILWPGVVSKIMWDLFFKTEYQRYNRL